MKKLLLHYPSRGFTLLEIMLVVAIISLLLGAAILGMQGTVVITKDVVAEADIGAFAVALNGYQIGAGQYPTTAQGLDALTDRPRSEPLPKRWHKIMDEIKKDPWGNDYVYSFPGKHNPDRFDLFSKGADGQAGTADDIVNWKVSAK